MIDEFLWRALIGGLGVVLASGPLGCFIVWRRMAYFGDSLAHSALLGIALGFLIGIEAALGIVIAASLMAIFLVLMQQQRRLASDTLIGIMAHAGLAFGLIALSFVEGLRIDLMSYLFGDILAITWGEILWILAGAVAVLGALFFLWRPLLAMTLHEELAAAEGVPVIWLRLAFVLLIAMVIASAMKVVGVLMITALLIVPPAAARSLARTPEQMAVLAIVGGGLAVAGGLAASLTWDTPSGPSIVAVALTLFAASLATSAAGWRR